MRKRLNVVDWNLESSQHEIDLVTSTKVLVNVEAYLHWQAIETFGVIMANVTL